MSYPQKPLHEALEATLQSNWRIYGKGELRLQEHTTGASAAWGGKLTAWAKQNYTSDFELGKAVFDVDDVAHGSQQRIARELNIPYENLDEFHIAENELLTDAQKDFIMQLYESPNFYENLVFYPGFEDLMDLEKKYPLRVQVNSNSCSQDVKQTKQPQIFAHVRNLPLSQMVMRVVGETTLQKRYDDDTIIAVDDSPYNIAMSPALFNIMPIQPWNQTTKATELISRKLVWFVPTGDFRYIYDAIDQFFFDLRRILPTMNLPPP